MEAATHSYLGSNLETIPISLNDELLPSQSYDMIILGIQDLVVFPGEVVPLRLHVAVLDYMTVLCAECPHLSRYHIGIVSAGSFNSNLTQFAKFGSSVIIRSMSVPSDNVVSLTSHANTRFKVDNYWQPQQHHQRMSMSNTGLRLATITTLPEIEGSIPRNHFFRSSAFPSWVSVNNGDVCREWHENLIYALTLIAYLTSIRCMN